MNDTPNRPTAAFLAIGDELLTGRTRDANAFHLGGWLETRGITLREVRIIPDEIETIAGAVRELRSSADLVFTSGGIGPTHDDITADAVAAAFDVPVVENDQALAVLEQWYAKKGESVTDRRRRMARTPEGARLVANSVSGAPGFVLDRTYVLAGVPAIFEAMLEAVADDLPRGDVYTVFTVAGEAQESQLAEGLVALESALHGVRIGSYPGKTGRGGPLAIVCKSFDAALAEKAANAVQGLFQANGIQATIASGFGPMRD